MKFLMIKFFPVIVLTAIVFVGLLSYNRKKYFDWIHKHWFFKKSFYNSYSFALLVLSFFLLLFSLLDVRGPQEQMEIDVPEQKTIIMIDSSASMLAEDVKPSRFKRSLFMAKHFVKKSVGHQVGVVLFSNIQKKIVPFTDDIDLLNARISGLETLNISRGGSNIAQAIQESLQYFKSSNKNTKDISGNILIFSDSEETESSFDINVPQKINVAFVGVGTLNGGKIPLRGKNGEFRGYKRYKGEDVISRLNENYIKKLDAKVSNFKYWIASSYTIYTDEIIKFFEKSFFDELESSQKTIIRPVWSHYIASVGIFFYILSSIFSQFNSFRKIVAILFLAAFGVKGDGYVWADVTTDLDRLKKGKLDKIQRLKLAEKFLKKDEKEKALKLYQESVGKLEDVDFSVLLNYGVALFKSGKIQEGMKIYDYLYRKVPVGGSEKSALQNNLLKALEEYDTEQKKKENEKDGKKGDENKQDGEKEESEEQGEKKDGGMNRGDSGEDDGDKENREKGVGQSDGQKKEESGQDESSVQKKNLTGRAAFEEKKKNMEKQRKLIKIPETLKSIMNKDGSLQDKFFDTSTHMRKRDRQIKDW